MKLLRFDPLDGYLYVAVKNLNRYNQPGGIIRKRRRKAPAPVQGNYLRLCDYMTITPHELWTSMGVIYKITLMLLRDVVAART